jgi:hypothetical protein
MDWRDLKREMLKDADVKREYDALAPEFALVRASIEHVRRTNRALGRRHRR